MKSSVLQQGGVRYNVAWGDPILVFSPPQTKKELPHNTRFATDCDNDY